MRILVRRPGWGRVKAPDNLVRWIYDENKVPTTNPDWIEYNKSNFTPVIAVNLLDEPLPVGEYKAKLTYQYWSDMSSAWFCCDDPRAKISKGHQVRLAFVKEQD